MFNKLIITPLLFFCFTNLLSQPISCITLIPRIDNNKVTSGEGVLLKGYHKYLTLVFEQSFKDSIVIKANNHLVKRDKILTLRPLGVCSNYFKIKRQFATDTISIIFPDRKSCIQFYIEKRKAMCYINRDETGFDVLLSDIARYYPPQL